jgi:transposase InsO family protein
MVVGDESRPDAKPSDIPDDVSDDEKDDDTAPPSPPQSLPRDVQPAAAASDAAAADAEPQPVVQVPQAKVKTTRVTRYQHRLIGEDKLLVKSCWFNTAKSKTTQIIWAVVVPPTLVQAVIALFHGDKSPIGHGGKHKTYGSIRRRFVWRAMTKDIRLWIGSCHKCLIRKRRVPEHSVYNVHPKAVAPMNRICIDMVGPFVPSNKGNAYILTIYDPFSHWPSAYAVPDLCFKQHITIHSVPAEVLSDRGKNFMSAAVKDFLNQMGAKKFETAPYKPSSNGSVERFHSYLTAAMTHHLDNEQETWDEFLDSVLFAYRTTPIDGLDISPFEVIYGRNPNLPIDNMMFRENYETPITNLQEYMDAVFEYQMNMCEVLQKARRDRFERNKRNHGSHKGIPAYKVGDKVYWITSDRWRNQPSYHR